MICHLKSIANSNASAEEMLLSVHTLKSSSQQIGSMQVYYVAKQLEKDASLYAKDGKGSQALQPIVTQLEELFIEAKTVVLEMIENVNILRQLRE